MYLHEEQIYLISNQAVARNTIFCNIEIQQHFKQKMEKYLNPLCDILAYSLKDHEFQLLVRLKKREVFEEYFNDKIKDIEGTLIVPQSTYIFSQAMSNLQNSLVKKFNFKYNRRGTLMAGRFERELISCKERTIELIQELNSSVVTKPYSGIWADCAMRRISAMTSREMYKPLYTETDGIENSFWTEFKNNLVGKFEPTKIEDNFFKFEFLHQRLLNSIRKHFS